MDIRSAAIERILAADPRSAMEATLSQLTAATGASAAALFRARQKVVLMWAVGIDQQCLDRAQKAWEEYGEQLRDGRPRWCDSWCVWPVEGERGPLLLYVAGDPLKLARVRAAVEGLAGLLRTIVDINGAHPDSPPDTQQTVDEYLQETSAEAIERRQLMLALTESEWNVSRAARALGVTRVTIYKRMRRHGIERLRIRKGEPVAQRE